jgi:hypothetical protein
MKKYFFIALIGILSTTNCFSQIKVNAMQGKDGVYIFLGDEAIGDNFKNVKYDKVKIIALNNGKEAEIGTSIGAKNFSELKNLISQEGINEFKMDKKLKSDNELFTYFSNTVNTNDYGLYVFNPKFMEALGVLYVHKINTKANIGKTLSYKLDYYKNNSKVISQNVSVDIVEKLNTPKPLFKTKREKDSVISIAWYTGKENMLGIIGANLYRSKNKGVFELKDRVFAMMPDKTKDTILLSYTDFTNKGDYNQYFIIPTNYAGFEGVSSDTIAAFSMNFSYIKQASRLKAKDTTYGIQLTFQPPPPSPFITGIIIQKSRYDNTGYINLDTVSASATNYLDENVLNNVTYYYQLKTLSIKQYDLLPTTWANATHNNKSNSVSLAPVNIKAAATPNGVIISWQAQANDDNAGFRVYRANNSFDKMQLVSLLQKGNSFTDTTALDNRRKYAYAVSSLSYADKESSLSEKVFVSPINNIVIPSAPIGLMGSAEQGRVLLSWTNPQQENAYVVGYKVYRKELVTSEKLMDKVLKVSELLQNGFKLITSKPIKAATYSDEFNTVKEKYAYYVTMIDSKGTESNAANGLIVEIPKIIINPPGNFSARKVSTGIAISWDKSKQENITGYVIYKREVTNPKTTQLIKLDINAETYTDKAVQKNKTYYYTIATTSGNNIGATAIEKGVFVN